MKQGPLDHDPIDQTVVMEKPGTLGSLASFLGQVCPAGAWQSLAQFTEIFIGEPLGAGLFQKPPPLVDALLEAGNDRLLFLICGFHGSAVRSDNCLPLAHQHLQGSFLDLGKSIQISGEFRFPSGLHAVA
jgi:hypothetical protein